MRILVWWNTIEEKLPKDVNYHKTKRYFLRSLEMALILRYMFHFLKPYFWNVHFVINNNELEQSERVTTSLNKINYLPSSNYIIWVVLKKLVEKVDWIANSVYYPNFDIKAVDILTSNWTIQRFTSSDYMTAKNIYKDSNIPSQCINWIAKTSQISSIIKFIDSSSKEPSFFFSKGTYKFLIKSFSWIYENKAVITESSKRQKHAPSSKIEFICQEEDVETMSIKEVAVPFWTKSIIFKNVIDINSIESYLEKVLNPTWTQLKWLV